jgi:Na+/phosphate symporter
MNGLRNVFDPFAVNSNNSNAFFNLAGLLLFLPFLDAFSFRLVSVFGDSAYAVAWSHLIFNLVIGIVFMLSMRLWLPILRRWLHVDSMH